MTGTVIGLSPAPWRPWTLLWPLSELAHVWAPYRARFAMVLNRRAALGGPADPAANRRGGLPLP